MAKPIYTDAQVIATLTNTGGALWKSPVITYNFPTSGSAAMIETWGASVANSVQQKMTDHWMRAWDDVIGSSIVRVASGTRANIGLANTVYTDYAHSYYPNNNGATVWFNPNYGPASGTNNLLTPVLGQYGGMAFGHEIGHALGLSHPGAYNGGRPTYEANAVYLQDSQQYTIMSYFSAAKTGADWVASDGRQYFAQTPMMNDILAIQSLYGVDKTTRTTDTVYGFQSNLSGSVYDFNSNKHPIVCLYDAGGTDTLNLSGFTAASRISLVAGSFSDCDGMTNNLSIACGVTIENATGGSANDSLTGNAANNRLDGGAGADSLSGGLGNDTYIVDNAGDKVIELANQGIDLVQSSVTYTLAANIENLNLSGSAAINGTGNDLNNVINGNAGNNVLDGGKGADTLAGGLGNDTYILDTPQDKIIEMFNQGLDTVYASITQSLSANVENLTLTGSAAINGTGNDLNNLLIGNAVANVLNGGGGNDILIGGGGRDVLTGGAGADKFCFIGVNDSTPGAYRDVINDFNSASGDIIDLSQLEAGLRALSSVSMPAPTFHWASNGLTGSAGDVCWNGDSLMCDWTGDAQADFQVQLVGVSALSQDAVLM